MAEQRRTYTAEFKREAVRLLAEHGYGVAQAARHLGLNTNMLRRWKREIEGEKRPAFPGNGRISPEQEDLYRLRAEHTRVRMERDILKTALGFCASESR
jgi:transposase